MTDPISKDFITRLVYRRNSALFGQVAYYLLKLFGLEFPRSVPVGDGLEIVHGGFGIVVHSKAEIGSQVKMYPGVTLGRADVHRPADQSNFEKIVIEDQVVLGAGCKVLCRDGVLRVGRGSVIGANAVLLQSTEDNEIWAGIPARKIGMREPTV